jgi:hypothetical protein
MLEVEPEQLVGFYSGSDLAFKVPQRQDMLEVEMSFLWAYSGTNLAFEIPPRKDMLEVEPEQLVAPTLPGINGQPVLLHLPKLRTTLLFMMVK